MYRNNIISQDSPERNDEFEIPADGVYPYPNDNEDNYVVIIDGDEVAWASDQDTAWRTYHEMLRVEREHSRSIPVYVEGHLVTTLDWDVCPDCGKVLDPGQCCPRCTIPFMGEPWPVADDDDYGLEARA